MNESDSAAEPEDPRVAEFVKDRLLPSLAAIRPQLRSLETKLRGGGVFQYSWEDLQNETVVSVLKSVRADPDKIEKIENVVAYLRSTARRVAQELRRGPGCRMMRYRVDAVFEARQDRLARWFEKRSLIGGFLEWVEQSAVQILDFWEPVIGKFNTLSFWEGEKLSPDAVERAIFDLFECTAHPVAIAQIVWIMARYCGTLDPVWVSATENSSDEGTVALPPDLRKPPIEDVAGDDDLNAVFDWSSEYENGIPASRGAIRFRLNCLLQGLSVTQRRALCRDLDLDWLRLSVEVDNDVLAKALGLESKEEFVQWLYKWVESNPERRKEMFDAGKDPDNNLYRARQNIKRLLLRWKSGKP
jgi:hypothetical protein